jgi:hypothetical protein
MSVKRVRPHQQQEERLPKRRHGFQEPSSIGVSGPTQPSTHDVHEPPPKNNPRRPSLRTPSSKGDNRPSNGEEPDPLENLNESARTIPLRLNIHEPPLAYWLDDGLQRKILADSKRIAL